jgi:hypothetical protein
MIRAVIGTSSDVTPSPERSSQAVPLMIPVADRSCRSSSRSTLRRVRWHLGRGQRVCCFVDLERGDIVLSPEQRTVCVKEKGSRGRADRAPGLTGR